MFDGVGRLWVFPEKVIILVDPDLAKYYRSLIPKYVGIQCGRYAPHITLVREEPISKEWKNWDRFLCLFKYDPYIQNDGGVYWWLNVNCNSLKAMRLMHGLPEFSEKSRPPDGSDNYHITLGNTKHKVDHVI